MSDIDDLKANHQVDHLILLVGGNPLPNAISGSLLVKPGGRITLIHSRSAVDETKEAFLPNTEKVADRISASFDPGMELKVTKKPLDNPADRLQIQTAVREALKDEQGSFGLNYTGGTKAMSVHAYRAVEEIAIKKRKNAVFSYLDTHSRKMMIDEAKYNPDMGNLKYPTNSTPYKIGEFYFSRDKMLTLHHWELNPAKQPEYQPVLPETCKEIAQLNTHHATEWLAYRDQYKEKRSLGATIARPNDAALDKFWEIFQSELTLPPDKATIATEHIIKQTTLKTIEEVREWLTAKWLESLSLNALQQYQQKHGGLADVCMSLRPHRIGKPDINFELDCAAIRGYQLFAISCTVDVNEVATEHLIEVSVRSKQIAGDAARICLICNHGAPDIMREKILKSMDEGTNLLILGKKDIVKLDAEIEKWIDKCISYS